MHLPNAISFMGKAEEKTIHHPPLGTAQSGFERRMVPSVALAKEGRMSHVSELRIAGHVTAGGNFEMKTNLSGELKSAATGPRRQSNPHNLPRRAHAEFRPEHSEAGKRHT
jgi:hypothetical protein